MTSENRDVYERYLRIFSERFGDLDFGQPVRNDGYLVKKLTGEEFSTLWTRYRQLENYLRDTMSAGHTLSDAVEYQYRELCAAVLEKPKDFKLL